MRSIRSTQQGLDPEIGLSVKLNQYAIARCLRIKQGHAPAAQESDVYESLLQEFETLWTARSRIGGLAESLELMRAVEH